MNTLELYTASKSILATLPIAHYLRNSTIPATLDISAKTSYFDPESWKVVISFSNIAENAKNTNPTTADETEKIVRCFLYHELSHVIMTPARYLAYSCDRLSQLTEGKALINHDLMNILEDQRIETILKDYYFNVNFKWNFENTCPLVKDDSGKSFTIYVFNAVRHGYAPFDQKEIEGHISDFIKATSKIGASGELDKTIYLAGAMEDLLEYLKTKFDELTATASKEEKKPENGRNASNGDDSKEESDKGDSQSQTAENGDSEEDEKEEPEDGKESKGGNASNENEEDSETEESQSDKDEESKDENEDDSGMTTEELQDLINQVVYQLKKQYYSGNGETKIKASDLVANKQAKTEMIKIIGKNAGFGIAKAPVSYGYSGKLNAKRYMTDFDDSKKWFQKKSLENAGFQGSKGNKKTLNIWLDNSVSYSRNDDATNGIIKALIEIEQSRSDFKFNLVKVTTDFVLKEGEERVSDSDGDNDLPADQIKEVYKKINGTGKEFNIVLFDGKAGYDYSGLAPFNNKRSVFITEKSNFAGIKGTCPNARDIINESTNYPERLSENVIKALDMLF